MSDSDRPSRESTGAAHPTTATTTTPSAGTVLGTAAASSAEYSAATTQGAATALVRLLMEQMVFGPGSVAPGDRVEAPATGARARDADDGDLPDRPAPERGSRVNHEKEMLR
ncbi:hypothetical protein F0344_34790 (plasmid) [Streptomyces finlayi]|uniref:Uncharacterized protein n=1 Tax=Streptomyces finlayi TaxID=67296 RepID=A0A7G7BWB4_9ACTN|nr:hypothetical protein [Streptomyces finlayi]QNE79629.1 hypothetical protein F0344_34790 [Streptomyces finlayi]